jgi:SNF2 family DNA or RNA helicase
MGFDAPYRPRSWPGIYQPEPHQLDMINFHLKHHRCFNLSEMGSMKTAPALWAADLMMKQGKVKKVLVLSPLSTLTRVWQQEIFDVCMHRTCVIVHGTEEQRRAALASDVDFYILNHDGVKIAWLKNLLRKRKDIDLVIVDEGGEFRNKSDKFDSLEFMLRTDQRVWWLTGTPCPNGPEDAYNQCRIINPSAVPSHRGTWKRMTMIQISQFKWVPLKGAEKMVHAAMQPAIRFMKKDVQKNLPPVTTIKFDAPLTKEQITNYNDMKRDMIMSVGTSTISAVHAADQINKLRQVLCGVIKDPKSGNYLPIGFGPRLNVLRQIINGASAKVIVIVPFKGIIEALAKELARPIKGQPVVTVGVLNGDVNIRARDKIISAFKNTPDPHVLLCHPEVMAHGLNLTEADVTVFWAPIYSNDQFEQVIERFNRKGQTRAMTIARIAGHPLEWAIYRLIDERRLNQRSILDLYHNLTTGQPFLAAA